MAPGLDPYFSKITLMHFFVFVWGVGGRSAAPYQDKPKSKNVDMALGLASFFYKMLSNSKYLDWSLGAGG